MIRYTEGYYYDCCENRPYFAEASVLGVSQLHSNACYGFASILFIMGFRCGR